jgi:hypothetical protein
VAAVLRSTAKYEQSSSFQGQQAKTGPINFFRFKKKKKKNLGKGDFQNIFLNNFLAKSGNSKHFSFTHFCQKKN